MLLDKAHSCSSLWSLLLLTHSWPPWFHPDHLLSEPIIHAIEWKKENLSSISPKIWKTLHFNKLIDDWACGWEEKKMLNMWQLTNHTCGILHPDSDKKDQMVLASDFTQWIWTLLTVCLNQPPNSQQLGHISPTIFLKGNLMFPAFQLTWFWGTPSKVGPVI